MLSTPSFFSAKPAYLNPYNSKAMAQLYDRPMVLYKEIFAKVKSELSIEKFPLALDVGCGTGISSHALKSIAARVIGVDPSENMLNHAKPDAYIEYRKAFAEKLPFCDSTFDLVTACVAFHFFDKKQFLKEAARVLKSNGHLVICYTNFTGLKTEAYDKWCKEVFYKKYPPTLAARRAFPQTLLNDDLPTITEICYPTLIEVDIDGLAQLLMSMSGPGKCMQEAKENPEKIKEWLLSELKPFFAHSPHLSFHWDITIWTLQRAPRPEWIHLPQHDSRALFAAKL
jgi:SAM-dependent methyltransferase